MKFGTDGVRGIANVDLTAEFALQLGRATARVLAPRGSSIDAVIGGDTRRSTPMLSAAFAAGLAAEGVTVHLLGVVPTPAVAFEANRRQSIGAVVSASHNPYRDNGIKIFARGGRKLPDAIEAEIEAMAGSLPPADGECGAIVSDRDLTPYVDHLVGVLDGRTLEGLRIVLDAANGAASGLAGDVFTRLGADVVAIHGDPDGRNINADCGATATASLAAAVVAEGADLGLAFDGDADRLIAVDGSGGVVDGDHVLAICAIDLRHRGLLDNDTVVVTVMSNLGFRLAMEAADVHVEVTPVGDRYVLEAIDAGGHSLGGEQSGHVIFRQWASTGDGMLTGLMLADIVARSGRSLAELAVAAMTRLPQVMINVAVANRVPDAADQLAVEIAAAEARLGRTGRVLVRASGTEPLVRVMVEAADFETASSIADELAIAAKARWGG